MPKEITHWLIAQEVLLTLPQDSTLRSILSAHRNLYSTSAILLDTPYYCLGRQCHKVKKSADHLHNLQSNTFEPLTQLLEAKSYLSFGAELSFISGIISHIIADSIFHPFVSALSGPESGLKSLNNTALHRHIETEIDLIFLKESQLFGGNLLRTHVMNLEVHKNDLATVLAIFFGMHDKQSCLLMKKSLRNHCLIQSLFYKKWPTWPLIWLNILKLCPTEHILALYYTYAKKKPPVLNCQPVTYQHPVSADTVSMTVEGLKSRAVEEISVIFSLLATAETRKELKNKLSKLKGPNLITGKYVHDSST